jgi:fucose permease
MFFVLTLYMQDVRHYSPLTTGLAWGPFGLGLFIGLGASTKVLPRFGVKYGLIFSYTLGAIGLFLLSGITPTSSYAGHLLPGMMLVSIGQGLSFPALFDAALHGLTREDAGLGSAVHLRATPHHVIARRRQLAARRVDRRPRTRGADWRRPHARRRDHRRRAVRKSRLRPTRPSRTPSGRSRRRHMIGGRPPARGLGPAARRLGRGLSGARS